MASSPAVHYTTKLLLLAFFLFAFAIQHHQTALGAVTSCPSGWSFHQGNCYRAQLPPLLGGYTYATAQAACQQIGGNLASLHNQAEAAFVTALYNAATSYGLLGAQNGLFYIGANYSVNTAVGAGTPGIASWQDGSSVADAPYNWGPPVDPSGDCSPYDCVVVYSIMNNGGAFPSENGQWNDVCCSYTFDAGLNARVGAMCKQGASHCPLGWTYYDGNCYRPDFSQVSTTTVSHAAAEQTCQSQGAHLTSVHSLAEWMFLRSLSALQPPSINGKIFGYYNGLRVEWTGNAISSANWTDNTLVNFGSPIGYPANGQPAGTIPWASGSPNPSNTNELCGMQWGLCPTCSSTWGDFGRWNDVGCTFNVGLVTLQPMCKKPLV